MTEAEKVAEGLSPAQQRAMICATVRKPHSIMPNYHPIEMRCCGMNGEEAQELREKGLCTLPIRSGGRSGPSVYSGEIHPLGLAVRDILRAKEADREG